MTSTLSKSGLFQAFCGWPAAGRYLVACSGGLDSVVLLHLAHALRAELPGEVLAVHVDHGISAHRQQWARLCESLCRDLDLRLIQLQVDARPGGGESPEDLARRMRYNALKAQLAPGDMLLTGHHADDQAETLLLQLFRGAGPAGLAAMPALRRFGPGWHGRPLLQFPRASVHEYAMAHALEWVDDESNADRRFDRNFLRHEIAPRLHSRWPSVTSALNRAARHQAAASALLRELAAVDMKEALDANTGTLSIKALGSMSSARRFNLLRQWIEDRELPLPDAAGLERIWTEVALARPDASPCVRWRGAEVRRCGDRLYAVPPVNDHDRGRIMRWDLHSPLAVPGGLLTAVAARGSGIRVSACTQSGVEVRYRQGGERLKLPGARHRRTLKSLLQEQGIPVWLRDRIPLLFIDGKLAAVAGLWVDAGFAAGAGEDGWETHWSGGQSGPGPCRDGE